MKIHAFAISILLVLAPWSAAEAKPLDYHDVFGLEYADSPRISPDGTSVVYVRHHMDSRTDRNLGQLWIIDLDSGEQQPLTSGEGSYSAPRWSPDGTRIAFVGHGGDGDSQLRVKWLDTGRTVQLTRGPQAPANPSWSPDGTRIAFNRFVAAEAPSLVKPLEAPEDAEWAPSPKVIDRPVFRVDGRGFLPHGQTQRFVVPAVGGPARQLTDGPYPNPGPAAWTGDGEALIFAANRRDDWELESNDTDLYRFELESGNIERLTERYGPDEAPAISPDGSRLAWLGFDDELMSYTNTEVWLMPIGGGRPENLTAELDRNVDMIVWADDGKSIFIGYSDEGTGVIDRLALDGTRTRLAENVGGTTLGRPYSSGDFDANAGQLVFTHTTPSHPANLVRVHEGDQTRLTHLNAELLAHRNLADVEEIRFESSHGGLEIQGWVAYPPGRERGERHPLILEIHGGPFADYGPRFSTEIQLMAAAGYAVAYLNPRGSTSYGADFANEIHHA